MNELIKAVESLKESMEQSIQTSKVLDIMVRRFLTEKEIEEVKKLHDQIDEELMEIKNIKGILWEAIHTFKSTNTDNKIGGLVAADG